MSKVFLLTGLSGAGKTTLARAVRDMAQGKMICALLDGDEMRKGVCRDLGFSPADREENIRRCGEFAKILADQGIIVLLAVIAPYEKLRTDLKNIIGEERLCTVHVDCPLEICMRRDPKKNYMKASMGHLANYTGLGDIYETPALPDLVIRTNLEHIGESAAKLWKFIEEKIGASA